MRLKTSCLAFRERTGNIGSKKITRTNKVIRDKSRGAQCFSDKSRFMKKNHNKKVVKTEKGRLSLSSKCAVCDSTKLRFLKEQETKGLLSNLGIKTPLSKTPLLNILFLNYLEYKMNQKVNKFLLTGDCFMPELHLKQSGLLDKSGFTYSACRPFTKNKQRIQKFMQTGDTNYICKNYNWMKLVFNMIWLMANTKS